MFLAHVATTSWKLPRGNYAIERLDLLPVQTALPHTQLETVVFGRIVRSRDLDAANDIEVVERPIKEGSRNDPDINDVDTRLRQPTHQGVTKACAARSVVSA